MEIAVLERERQHLQRILRYIEHELRAIDDRFAAGIHAADEAAEESVRQILEHRFRQLLLVKPAPYFARIDFQDTGRDKPQTFYLGKATVHDKEKEVAVVDWRAPVSSLYYENRLGPAEYTCPDGTVSGELTLKRQIEIVQNELIGYADIDITSDDDLLRPYLTVSADARLKNIIATIQTEQNRIIRADLHKTLIVQGAAGSGKTTVALHRIAYLVYTYAKSFAPENFCVLTPGGFFLHYIAGVLPDLGVERVVQRTYEDLAREKTRLKGRIAEQTEQMLAAGAQAEQKRRDAAYKGSLTCKQDLDAFLDAIHMRFLPAESFVLGGVQLETLESIRTMYEQDYAHLAYFERLEHIQRRLMHKAADWEGGKKAAAAFLRSGTKPNVLALYQEFWQKKGMAVPVRTNMSIEDLTPLLYLYIRVFGGKNKDMRHIVIDEAQDFSPFQLWVLKDMFPKATFTIFGDLGQSIYAYRGIESWEAVNQLVWQGGADIALLQKSYRATIEIMEAANQVLRFLPGIPPASAVVRHGEPVQMIIAPKDPMDALARLAAKRQAMGHHNIAVIMKDKAACQRVAKGLARFSELPFHCVLDRDAVYEGGLSILPAALSKGLEFDAVIIGDADHYQTDKTDAHLLYVAMTRAMHTLDILTEQGAPALLAP